MIKVKQQFVAATILVVLALSQDVVMAKVCSIDAHMKYKYTECDALTGTANVFFYYDNKDHCDIRPGKSETLPPFMKDVPCDHLCEHDG